MHIVFILDKILKERKISVRQLAADSGIHYRTALNVYHNRTTGVSLDTLSKICEALSVKPGDLFTIVKK